MFSRGIRGAITIEEDNQEAAGMAESEFPEEETNAQINAVKEETGNETGAEKSVVKPDLSPLLREQKIHIIKLEH